jgi:hypothetical protein
MVVAWISYAKCKRIFQVVSACEINAYAELQPSGCTNVGVVLLMDWFQQFDSEPCGCIPVAPCVPQLRRHFSPFCRMVDVTPSTPQVYFRVAPSVQHDSTALLFTHSRVYLELRRKGIENLLGTYNAWRRDANGNIGFYFDDVLFNSEPGFFIGDVFIDCVYCFSVQLRLPPCEAVVTDCYVQPIHDVCERGECTVVDIVGFGTIGSWPCNIVVPSICGDIAPYFELTNPGIVPAHQNPPPGCNTTGFTPIG